MAIRASSTPLRAERALRPSDAGWSNNAMTAGGGTRVYGAQAWRFGPKDFAMASTYGVPTGSDLADWPFGYDALEPYYDRAEWEIGVSGDVTFGAHAGGPTTPIRCRLCRRGMAARFSRRAQKNSALPPTPCRCSSTRGPIWGARLAPSAGCASAFACPVDAKNGSQNTMLDRAFATGRASMLLETTVERLVIDGNGQVIGVAVVGTRNGTIWRREILAEEVVLPLAR